MNEFETELDEQTTNQILNTVAKEYASKTLEPMLNDDEIDHILDEIEDKEEKSEEIPSQTNSAPSPNSENEHVTLTMNPNNVFIQRCNDLLNDELQLKSAMEDTFSWCGLNGLNYMLKDDGKYGHLPISIFPHLVSLSEWLHLRQCSLIFHKLTDRMTRDSEFLLSRMKCIAEADPDYTGKLYEIYKKKLSEKQFHSKYIFCSFRMDYMRNGNKNMVWSQIECQFTPGGIAWIAKTNQLHQYLMDRYIMDHDVPIYDVRNSNNNIDKNNLFLTPNDTIQRIAGAIATAAKLVHTKDPMVLVIADSSEQDCRLITQDLWETHRIKSIYRTYAEIGRNGKIEDDTKDLIMDRRFRVSFVYCRGGSKRKEFNDKDGMDWKGRELIEFSRAIVDANIAYTLINTKFMQTLYSDKKVLLQYLDRDEAELLHQHFVGNFNFDPKFKAQEEINKILDDIRRNYDDYVMKPSGDGGGHCIFGKDIVDLIDKLCKDDNKERIQLEGWIVMEKIKNCIGKTIHFRDNKTKTLDSVHEVGIYSQYLVDAATGDLVFINECIGDVSKTRNAHCNEAGISAGYGVIDSVVLDASK